MGFRRKMFFCFLTSVVLIAVDQVSKVLATHYLQGKGVVKILGDFFVLQYIQNKGAFLSLGSALNGVFWTVCFIVLPLIALVAISAYILIKKITEPYFLLLWVLVVSGGAGNLIDRIMYGKVTDFLNFGIGNLRTGILNIADLYICFFTVIVLLFYFLTHKEKAPDAEP